MSKWREVRLGDISEVFSGYAFKSNDFLDCGDIPVIKIGNINKTGINLKDNIVYADTIFLQKIDSKYQVKKGDILISLTGSNINQPNSIVGRVGLYRHENISFLNQRAGKIEPKAGYSRDYIFYLYSLKSITYYIASIAYGGANQVNISPTTIKNIKIKIPDLETQEKIAQVLSSYDELIENNNRRIELLENMAEEIYKEWFVRMRFPGHEEVRFKKGIPESWELKKIGDISDIKYGKNLPTDKLLKSGYEVFGGNGVIGYYQEYMYKEPKILISCRGAASGKIVISNEYSFVTNNSLVLDSISSRYFEYFKMYFMNQDLTPYVTGSAQPQITITNIGKMKVIIPDEKLIDELNAKLIYISSNITLLNKQNQNLIKQRDMLLPRLMNGTIEVK